MLPLLRCFFAHLLILQYPDHHQNLIGSYLYYSGPVHKISSQSVHNFLSNVVHRQTNRQTNATKNITSFAKEVIKNGGGEITDMDCHQVSVLTHPGNPYIPTNPRQRLALPCVVSWGIAHFMCGLMSDLQVYKNMDIRVYDTHPIFITGY